MKLITKICLLLLTLIFQNWKIEAQKINRHIDSLEVIEISNKFFDWYISSVKEQKYVEFRPIFAKGQNGMTTLDYSKYIENLRKYSFCENLIEEEIQSYQECIDNLKNISYSVFEKEYIDLDQFEFIKCDFTNSYRWTGGMDPIEYYRIKDISFIDNNTVKVEIEFSYFNPEKKDDLFFVGKRITLQRIDSSWKIFKMN